MSREPRPDSPAGAVDGEGRELGLRQLVELVYEATERPRALSEALALLAGLTGATSALLLDTRSDRQLVAAAHAASVRAPQPVRLPLHSDHLRTVPIAGGFELVLDHRSRAANAPEIVALFAPHLARAMRLAELRTAARSTAEANGAGALDRLPLALLLLDREGELVFLNRAARALLAPATALALDGRRLVPAQAVPRALLESLIERLTAPRGEERLFSGGRLELPDAAWGRIELLVAGYDTLAEGRKAAVAVILSAPGAAPDPAQRLRDLFELSSDEARLAGDLLAGRSPSGADGATNDALLHALYRKLGSTRQADLLRLLLCPPGTVFTAAPRGRPTPP